MSILLVEHDIKAATSITEYLELNGHCVDYAPTARVAKNLLADNSYSVVILDTDLPDTNSLDLCQQIKSQICPALPVLMLSAQNTLEHLLSGFQSGTDDYLARPFAMAELNVRLLALSRRTQLNKSSKITLGPLTVDRQSFALFRESCNIKCTRMGFQIMDILAEAYPKVVTQSELFNNLWGNRDREPNLLRSHIYQLRQVIDKPFPFPILKTIHGVGFTIQNIE